MTKIKKGVCKNYDNCDKADNKEIQEIKSGEPFVCKGEGCGKKLVEITTPKNSSPSKFIIIAVIAVLLIGGGIYFGLGGDKKPPSLPPEPDTLVVDTLKVDTTIVAPLPVVDEPTAEDSKKEEPITKPQNGSGSLDLGYALYEGPIKNGKPHGVGGKLTFKRKHTIDLKKMPAEYLEVSSGDIMVSVKFDNGRLVQGELRRADGTRKWIHI
ncbi:MAG: hypothetical protein LUH22_00925 [Bacteroides sp.]|nr:hypothetical protein [Bacteroides sp.]